MDKFHDLIQSQALLSSALSKQIANTSSSSTSSERRYRCTECSQAFSRAEHLKRHQTRHTGAKPFSCVFCSREFSRKDRLQTHYSHCQRRGDREPPNSVPKGRRPHACVTCISSKIRCDGGDPCAQCKKKKVSCRRKSVARSEDQNVKDEPIEDRVSIKALLNGGTDTFTETFNLPPCDDRLVSLQFHAAQNQDDAEESGELRLEVTAPAMIDYSAMFSDAPIEIGDQYLDFWTGPFGFMASPNYGDVPMDFYDPSLMSADGMLQPTPSDSTQNPPPDQAPYISAISMAIYNKLWCLSLDAKIRQELTACLNFLLTAEKIPKFVSIYFRNWHLNSPMIHKPSFDPSQAPLGLVIGIVFVGAMYSKDQTERLAAKRLVDIAELVVFDSEIFSYETEATRFLQSELPPVGSDHGDPERDWALFQEVQAGFLMVVAQYWAGNRVQKRRAMESRLGDVIKVLRRFQIHKARHLPSDRISETVWLRKECRIRTIAVIALIDCAMRIYSNYPCRLTLAELDCDLPCKEATFSSRHPFMQDESIFAPRMTICQAFAMLFADKVKVSGSSASMGPDPAAPRPDGATDAVEVATGCDLTMFDLFILIHYLYVYIHTCIMSLSLNLHTTSLSQRPSGPKTMGLVAGSLTGDIKSALERWRRLWQALYAQSSEQSMKLAGMYRNSFYFWMVLQLIMTKDQAVDVITGMEIGCDDALTKFKVLFPNESENE